MCCLCINEFYKQTGMSYVLYKKTHVLMFYTSKHMFLCFIQANRHVIQAYTCSYVLYKKTHVLMFYTREQACCMKLKNNACLLVQNMSTCPSLHFIQENGHVLMFCTRRQALFLSFIQAITCSYVLYNKTDMLVWVIQANRHVLCFIQANTYPYVISKKTGMFLSFI